MSSFFLAMSLYPEVQARAQAEIDQVVGQSRLPSWDDHDSLPYLEALVKEVLRWNPVTPSWLVQHDVRSWISNKWDRLPTSFDARASIRRTTDAGRNGLHR